ncbi:MAG: hypothetical protein MJ071_08105 [Oscillospiraceae bacterium]|nr:hypothetical protein [Oscillospiraceae bacterium]
MNAQHNGHRKRMKERFLQQGLDGFDETEILEFLLYYSIPRADTRPAAEALMKQFGSVQNILAADDSALSEVRGMTQNTLTMLHFLRQLYAQQYRVRHSAASMEHAQKACSYFEGLFAAESGEILYAVTTDETLCIQEGKALPLRLLYQDMLCTDALKQMCRPGTSLLMAHHFPEHMHMPREETAFIRNLAVFLEEADLHLMDYIVVEKHKALSMREAGAYMGIDAIL